VQTGGRLDILSICCNSNKVFTLMVFALVVNAISARQFLIALKRQILKIKSSSFVNSVYNAIKLSRSSV